MHLTGRPPGSLRSFATGGLATACVADLGGSSIEDLYVGGTPDMSCTVRDSVDLDEVARVARLRALALHSMSVNLNLAPLRHATNLRALDIRQSTGISDLSSLIGHPSLQSLMIEGSGVTDVPDELRSIIN